MKPCVLAEEALYTILLHAAKHPTSAVNGLLLGTAGPGVVEVARAVPVCHSFITLTPLLEAALAQIEQYAKEGKAAQPGLRLVGYYQCNERLVDGELGAGRRVADRIEADFSDAVALVLDAPALETVLKAHQQEGQVEVEQPVVHLFCKDGSRGWVKVATGGKGGLQCPTKGLAARLAQYTGEGRHHQLCDFEEHVDDISCDWLNPGLLQGPA